MKSRIKVLKRDDRERTTSSDTVDRSKVQHTTPEIIVKNWISASRERRRIEAEEYQRRFNRWEESLALAGS